jgi:hypothetical protein
MHDEPVTQRITSEGKKRNNAMATPVHHFNFTGVNVEKK